LSLLALIERATDGWGVDGRFFAPGPLEPVAWWQVFVVYTIVLLAFFVLGTVAGAAWVRWKARGVYLFIGAVVGTIVALVWVVTALKGWGEVGDYLSGHSVLTHAASSLPFTAVGALIGYALMRRATPRN
jgi:hypothetical protein